MATEAILQKITLPTAADLSASQYCAARVDSNGNAALCGVDQMPIGILQDNQAGVGVAASVAVAGMSKIKGGGSLNPGDRFMVDASGRAVAIGSGDPYMLGIMLDAVSLGTIGRCLIQKMHL